MATRAKGEGKLSTVRQIAQIPMPEEPASVRRRRLRAARQPRTVDSMTAAELAIEEREKAPIRHIPAWKGAELWCTAVLRDGTHYEGPFAKLPEVTAWGEMPDGSIWEGPASRLPKDARFLHCEHAPQIDSITVRDVVLRPSKTYDQRRGLSWLAKMAQSGALAANEAAAVSRWRDDLLGSNCMPGSILDPDRTFGGSGGIPHTRLLAAAACSESYNRACDALREASTQVFRVCKDVFLQDKSPDLVAESKALLPNEVRSILQRGARLLVKHYGSGSRQ